MDIIKLKIILITFFLSLTMVSSAYAMEGFCVLYGNDFNDKGYCDREGNIAKDCWVWINGYCYHIDSEGRVANGTYVDGYGLDPIGRWTELIPGTDDEWRLVERTIFTGQWITIEDGSKNFLFDDGTVALSYQKIDGNLYYFKATGALAVNYEAECGTTNENGIITELISGRRARGMRRQLEEIQNLPECFTRKEESEATE